MNISISKITGQTIQQILRGKPVVVNLYRRPVAFLARLPENDIELVELIDWLKERANSNG